MKSTTVLRQEVIFHVSSFQLGAAPAWGLISMGQAGIP
jgi:hypothetical protein